MTWEQACDADASARFEQHCQDARKEVMRKRADNGIVGWTFGAAVPGAIVRVAVAVVLAIRLVVLVIVGNEVAKSEAVVGNDEIDARPGLSAAKIEFVGRSAEPRRKPLCARHAAPEVARCVPERSFHSAHPGGKPPT